MPALLDATAVVAATSAVAIERPRSRFQRVNFAVDCGFSHRLRDDPIVAPGRPGASHEHAFFGNRTTNAHATAASLAKGRTTCARRADRSGYWVPMLYQDGVPVVPLGAAVYYKRRTTDPTQPIPAGLRVVAGDPSATTPQGPDRVFWTCEPEGPAELAPVARPSGGAYALRLHVLFPQCRDGVRLDSDDHRSHLAYADADEACPATHPVALPAVKPVVRHPVTTPDGLAFSSGGIHSAHADFFAAWRPKPLARLIDGCPNAERSCERLPPARAPLAEP